MKACIKTDDSAPVLAREVKVGEFCKVGTFALMRVGNGYTSILCDTTAGCLFLVMRDEREQSSQGGFLPAGSLHWVVQDTAVVPLAQDGVLWLKEVK